MVEDRQVARGERRAERLLDTALRERDATLAEGGETVRVGLDQLDRMALGGQADGADEADVAGTDDGDGSPGGGVMFRHRADSNRSRA